MLQKVWEWANNKLTTEEININLLLATNREEPSFKWQQIRKTRNITESMGAG